MAIYMVDYSSVRSDGLDGIDKLSAEDSVYIYYNMFYSFLTFSVSESIRNSAAKVETVNVGYQIMAEPTSVKIAAMLGYAIGDGGNDGYAVISEKNALSELSVFFKKQSPKSNLVFADSISEAQKRIAYVNERKSESDAQKEDSNADRQERNDGLEIPNFLRK